MFAEIGVPIAGGGGGAMPPVWVMPLAGRFVIAGVVPAGVIGIGPLPALVRLAGALLAQAELFVGVAAMAAVDGLATGVGAAAFGAAAIFGVLVEFGRVNGDEPVQPTVQLPATRTPAHVAMSRIVIRPPLPGHREVPSPPGVHPQAEYRGALFPEVGGAIPGRGGTVKGKARGFAAAKRSCEAS